MVVSLTRAQFLWILVPLLLATLCVIPAKRVIKIQKSGPLPEAPFEDCNAEVPLDIDESLKADEMEIGPEFEYASYEEETNDPSLSETNDGKYEEQQETQFTDMEADAMDNREGKVQGMVMDYEQQIPVQGYEISVAENEEMKTTAAKNKEKTNSVEEIEQHEINVAENGEHKIGAAHNEKLELNVPDNAEKETIGDGNKPKNVSEAENHDKSSLMLRLFNNGNRAMSHNDKGGKVHGIKHNSFKRGYHKKLSKASDTLQDSEKEIELDKEDGFQYEEENGYGLIEDEGDEDDKLNKVQAEEQSENIDFNIDLDKCIKIKNKDDAWLKQKNDDNGLDRMDRDLPVNEEDGANVRVDKNKLSSKYKGFTNAIPRERNMISIEDTIVNIINKENLGYGLKDASVYTNRDPHLIRKKEGNMMKRKTGIGGQTAELAIKQDIDTSLQVNTRPVYHREWQPVVQFPAEEVDYNLKSPDNSKTWSMSNSKKNNVKDGKKASSLRKRRDGYSPIRLMPLRFPKRRHSHTAAHKRKKDRHAKTTGDDQADNSTATAVAKKHAAKKHAEKKHAAKKHAEKKHAAKKHVAKEPVAKKRKIKLHGSHSKAAKRQATRTNEKTDTVSKPAAKKQVARLYDRRGTGWKRGRRYNVKLPAEHHIAAKSIGAETCSLVLNDGSEIVLPDDDSDKDPNAVCQKKPVLPDYSYGPTQAGPDNWVDKYPDCGGDRQSPINLDTSTSHLEYEPLLKWRGYDTVPCRITITNNGKTVVMVPSYDTTQVPYITDSITKVEFVLGQIHFHWGADNKHGSEHTIDYNQFAMEMHSVHYKRDLGGIEKAVEIPGGVTIVATLFKVGKSNQGLRNLQWGFNKIRRAPKTGMVAPFPICHLVRPFAKHYLTYNGSLTTPPCTETIRYIVDMKISHVSKAQLSRFRRMKNTHGERILHNFRPVQPTNCREVLQAA